MPKQFKIPGPTEHQIQSSLVQHLHARTRSGVFWFGIGNGGKRDAVAGAFLKKEGVRAGVPDMCFVINGVAHFLELKESGGRLSEHQELLKEEIESSGAVWDVAVGLDQALDRLKGWGALK